MNLIYHISEIYQINHVHFWWLVGFMNLTNQKDSEWEIFLDSSALVLQTTWCMFFGALIVAMFHNLEGESCLAILLFVSQFGSVLLPGLSKPLPVTLWITPTDRDAEKVRSLLDGTHGTSLTSIW